MTINVTSPYLPPIEELTPYLEQIWKNKWLTNKGPFHEDFEAKLTEYLGVSYVSVFANGTLALLTALQALDISGEVITTPYSFVATSHALLWNKNIPVFVDVDAEYGNIDPAKIESAITAKTSAILAVHVYGNPCNIVEIERIAKKHNLKVIYDAAHAFAVKKDGESILNQGDLSILSFHATKVFNTFEGGAIISKTKEQKQRIDDLKNFGFRDEVTVVEPGINGKMNEFQSVMGLLQLNYVDKAIAKRKEIAERYFENIKNIEGIRFLHTPKNTVLNYSYFPIFVQDNFPVSRDELYEMFREKNILVRRYFYPLISEFPMYVSYSSKDVKNAKQLSEQVICLPIYPDLTIEEVDMICELIVDV